MSSLPPPPGATPPPEPERHVPNLLPPGTSPSNFAWVAVVVVGLLAIGGWAWKSHRDEERAREARVDAVTAALLEEGPQPGEAITPTGSSVIEYRISGTAPGADITIVNAQGNIEQASGRANNQRIYLGPVESGEFVSISAQNVDDSGTITCEILADGEVISEATSAGAYVIASCDATVP